MLTYERQKELVALGLATVSINGNLATFKYAKKVMFDYMWDQHPDLLECRGHTYDIRTGALVVAAPRKSFNYLENGTWKDIPLSTPVTAYKKFNGFMACQSGFEGKNLYSTTGSTKSDFVQMAKDTITKDFPYFAKVLPGPVTELYEIIHKDDPHIVADPIGAHYLGERDLYSGRFIPAANEHTIFGKTLGQVVEFAQDARHEGFMVYTKDGQVCKLKTPYYIGKKKLMRQRTKAINGMYDDPAGYVSSFLISPHWQKEWYFVAYKITQTITKETWTVMDDQHRRLIIEELHG